MKIRFDLPVTDEERYKEVRVLMYVVGTRKTLLCVDDETIHDMLEYNGYWNVQLIRVVNNSYPNGIVDVLQPNQHVVAVSM